MKELFTLTDVMDRKITSIAKQNGVKKIEVMRMAMSLFFQVYHEMKKGKKLVLLDKRGEQQEIILHWENAKKEEE